MESVKIIDNLMFHILDQIERDDNIVFIFSL